MIKKNAKTSKLMMNKLTIKHLMPFAACACAALVMTACSNNDAAQQETDVLAKQKAKASFTGSQGNSNKNFTTRTAATYTLGGTANVTWGAADKVFVKDDAGTFRQSAAATFLNPASKVRATFFLNAGSFTQANHEVHYTGENGTSANAVTIATAQSQATANNFSHLGVSGDCGTATAAKGNGGYTFTLNHKASYLCFVPRCMNTELGPNIYLTKITVKADKPIAGVYDFSDGSLIGKTPTSSASNTITLTTGNFSLNTTTSDITKNGAYMVIAPGTYNFTITYTIKDPVTAVEANIVKTVNAFSCAEGTMNNITAWIDKDILKYNSEYYTWDAPVGYHYWKGYEQYQPKINKQTNTTYNPESRPDLRWPNVQTMPYAATRSCATCPTINAMTWYVKYGEPHWDETTLWTTMGHLYNKGLWLKKSTKIPGFRSDRDIHGNDLRTTVIYANYENHTINQKPASTADFFYLPCLGRYYKGELVLGEHGLYWCSSAGISGYAGTGDYGTGSLYFYKNYVCMHYDFYFRGQKLWTLDNVPTEP